MRFDKKIWQRHFLLSLRSGIVRVMMVSALLVVCIVQLASVATGLQSSSASSPPANDVTNWLSQPLRDLKPPVKVPKPFPWQPVLGLTMVGLLTTGLYWMLFKVRAPAAKSSSVTINKREADLTQAMKLLDQARGFFTDSYRCCCLISDALRLFVEAELHIPTTGATTSEVRKLLEQSGHLEQRQIAELSEILGQCDLAKFARKPFTPDQLRDLFRQALSLMGQMHRRERSEGSCQKKGLSS